MVRRRFGCARGVRNRWRSPRIVREGLGHAAVVLTGDLRPQIWIAEMREKQIVEAWRAEPFRIVAPQSDSVLREGYGDGPRRAHLLAEVAVTVDSESSGRNQMI